MARKTYSAELQSMIDQASELTDEQIELMGRIWKADEEIHMTAPSYALGIVGESTFAPYPTNLELITAWQAALDAAGKAGRVDEIEAAEDAGRAALRAERHSKDDEYAKDGAAQAVRAAVLATGVRDLITEDEFATLFAAWHAVLPDRA